MDAKRHSPFRVELRAQTDGAGYNCMLLPSRKFSVMLPVGTYDLELVVLGKGETLHKRVSVRENVTLKENESCVLSIK